MEAEDTETMEIGGERSAQHEVDEVDKVDEVDDVDEVDKVDDVDKVDKVDKVDEVDKVEGKDEKKPEDDGFVLVSRGKRKVKRKADEMDTTESGSGETRNKPQAKKPFFAPLAADELRASTVEVRKVRVPAHRYTPLKENWMKIYTPLVEHLHLQVRFNLKSRDVEMKTCKETEDVGALQKGADFVQAFVYGFDVDDALALVRLDELFLESFEVHDVKPLKGDHLSRAIGRVAGKGGKTRFTIENVTKTRIVLADSKIYIMGSYQNIRAARTAICNLILGSPPSKVYGQMRTLASRAAESF